MGTETETASAAAATAVPLAAFHQRFCALVRRIREGLSMDRMSMKCRAYDYTGNNRPLHELVEGDLIDWKRNGSTGFIRARVTALVPEAARPIRIRPLDRDGSPTGREVWVKPGGVMYIFDAEGERKEALRDQSSAA